MNDTFTQAQRSPPMDGRLLAPIVSFIDALVDTKAGDALRKVMQGCPGFVEKSKQPFPGEWEVTVVANDDYQIYAGGTKKHAV